MKDEKLTVFLSPGELFCIAGSLGMANLPLISSHYRGYTPEQIREEINKGREVLESRGMIKRFGPRNWEVDASLTGLVESIARPEYCMVLSAWRKNEANQQVFLYLRSRQGLSVTYKDRFFNLSVYREVKMMVKYVLGWLGIAQQSSQGQPEFSLPLMDLRAMLQKIWEKPEEGPAVLTGLGVPASEAGGLAELLNQVSSTSNLSLIIPEGERFNRQGQLFFLNNPMNLWFNESIKPPVDALKFTPVPAGKASLRIDRYLRGKVGEEALAGSEEENQFL